MTGLLGEVFGAAQAVKVAGAEERVVAHFRELNEVAPPRRRCATASSPSSSQSAATNTANLGTGLLLLLAARSMRDGRFTVGDFALFVSYLGWLTQITSHVRRVPDPLPQMGVSLQRLQALLAGAPPGALVGARTALPAGAAARAVAPERSAGRPLRDAGGRRA